MLYYAAMLLRISRIIESMMTFEDVLLAFDSSTLKTPHRRMPSLYICAHVPSTSAVPFGQKHDALPRTEVFVPLQFWHGAAPVASLYVPTEHAVQGPPSGPVVPTGQTQPVL
jgi:hypothetical protein